MKYVIADRPRHREHDAGKTLRAFQQHGYVRNALEEGATTRSGCSRPRGRVDYTDVTDTLERGVRAFGVREPARRNSRRSRQVEASQSCRLKRRSSATRVPLVSHDRAAAADGRVAGTPLRRLLAHGLHSSRCSLGEGAMHSKQVMTPNVTVVSPATAISRSRKMRDEDIGVTPWLKKAADRRRRHGSRRRTRVVAGDPDPGSAVS